MCHSCVPPYPYSLCIWLPCEARPQQPPTWVLVTGAVTSPRLTRWVQQGGCDKGKGTELGALTQYYRCLLGCMCAGDEEQSGHSDGVCIKPSFHVLTLLDYNTASRRSSKGLLVVGVPLASLRSPTERLRAIDNSWKNLCKSLPFHPYCPKLIVFHVDFQQWQ